MNTKELKQFPAHLPMFVTITGDVQRSVTGVIDPQSTPRLLILLAGENDAERAITAEEFLAHERRVNKLPAVWVAAFPSGEMHPLSNITSHENDWIELY